MFQLKKMFWSTIRKTSYLTSRRLPWKTKKCCGLLFLYLTMFIIAQRTVFRLAPVEEEEPILSLNDQLKKRILSDNRPVINHLHYAYPINLQKACQQRTVKIFMPVHSAVTNFKRRGHFRSGGQSQFASKRENQALTLFFVALPSDKVNNSMRIQRLLLEESRKHRDIVQMNITDTYRNLTLKALGVYNWIITYCPNSKVVIKFDDDVKTSPSTLLPPIYAKMALHPNFIIGETIYKGIIDRNLKSRWYVSKSEYSSQLFPAYATGHAIGHPTSTVELLYRQGLRTKLNAVDDVFISGICRYELGIPIFPDSNFHKNKTVIPLPAEDFVVS